eukprot:scaffold76942_cov78-Phaeocystis_antarctica.AAC.1
MPTNSAVPSPEATAPCAPGFKRCLEVIAVHMAFFQTRNLHLRRGRGQPGRHLIKNRCRLCTTGHQRIRKLCDRQRRQVHSCARWRAAANNKQA